jgi:protein gp37
MRVLHPAKYDHDFSEVRRHPDELDKPLHWRKPRMVFVNSMSDLFHEDVPFIFIAEVFHSMVGEADAVGWHCGHTYQILTKRPQRALLFFRWLASEIDGGEAFLEALALRFQDPPRNVWIGASASTQEDLDRVLPPLLDVPAAVRFLSLEPLLGRLRPMLERGVCDSHGPGPMSDGLARMINGRAQVYCATCGSAYRKYDRIDWVIVGGESGSKARPMHPAWVRDIRDQCVKARVPFFFKQWGEWAPDCIHPGDWNGDHKPCRTTPRPDRPTGVMFRCGKKAAGRELDGKVWDQFPHARP